jgi:hypothetical protein
MVLHDAPHAPTALVLLGCDFKIEEGTYVVRVDMPCAPSYSLSR